MGMEDNLPTFVLAWITEVGVEVTPMGKGGRVLFVEHPDRGWEIPGGHCEVHESPSAALTRELQEETGLSGTIVGWNKNFYPSGWVAHVLVEATPSAHWNVADRGVNSVQWWDHTPPTKKWTPEEFEDLANYFSLIGKHGEMC